jgi:hypothetical protein
MNNCHCVSARSGFGVASRAMPFFRVMVALFGGFLIASQFNISPAHAQTGFDGKIDDEWLEPVNPADKLKPKAKQGKQQLRVPTCPNGKAVPKECMDLFEQLKKLLQAYYIQEYDAADAALKDLADKLASNGSLTPDQIKEQTRQSDRRGAAGTGLSVAGGKNDVEGRKAARKVADDPNIPKDLSGAIVQAFADLKKCLEKCKEEPKATPGTEKKKEGEQPPPKEKPEIKTISPGTPAGPRLTPDRPPR